MKRWVTAVVQLRYGQGVSVLMIEEGGRSRRMPTELEIADAQRALNEHEKAKRS